MSNPSANLEQLLKHGYRYAFSLTHNKATAEDLLQDTWVAILKADGPLVKYYLFTAIRNHYINQNKRDRLVPMVALDTELFEQELLEQQQASDNFSIDINLLDISLASLRAVEREAIYLSAVEGYTAQEIADHTRQPRGTILSLIHRARKKLRQHFSQDVQEVKS